MPVETGIQKDQEKAGFPLSRLRVVALRRVDVGMRRRRTERKFCTQRLSTAESRSKSNPDIRSGGAEVVRGVGLISSHVEPTINS